MFDTYLWFGKSVAIDATDIKGWSNGIHRTPTDKDAGWIVKTGTNGKGKATWGFRMSLLVDTTYELPISTYVTSGSTRELKAAPPLLNQVRNHVTQQFHPQYVLADAGYSSEEFRQFIKRQYRAEPLVKTNASHKKAIQLYPETPEWKKIYNRRVSVEHVFGRLKEHRKLNSVRVRGLRKVEVHCFMSVIVLQAQAMATSSRGLMRKVVGRGCAEAMRANSQVKV